MTGLRFTSREYPCGCKANGPGELPHYCPTHGADVSVSSKDSMKRWIVLLSGTAYIGMGRPGTTEQIAGDCEFVRAKDAEAEIERLTITLETQHGLAVREMERAERLRAALPLRPIAWMRGVVSHNGPNGPDEYDADFSYGDDRPDGEGWVPLYLRPETAGNSGG